MQPREPIHVADAREPLAFQQPGGSHRNETVMHQKLRTGPGTVPVVDREVEALLPKVGIPDRRGQLDLDLDARVLQPRQPGNEPA